ncbi:MAG TPA: metallophosphoesterase [Usitatibacter sp.]|nr:metallophosphoesterase [Usitatibacter sp.]
MRTLVQLSDLHFGAIDEELLEPLRSAVAAVAPNLVVVSGDLTQRARPGEFRAARAFLDSLPYPRLAVPGNHDVPLYAVSQRLLSPLRRYRRHFAPEVETSFVDEEIAVVGVNTARSLVIKAGRINEEQVRRALSIFRAAPRGATRIVVTHHPLELPSLWREHKQLAGRAAMALETLAECADVYLSGHLHRTHSGQAESFAEARRGAPLIVAAGTATSTRGRGETNSFNVLRIRRGEIEVEHFCWDERSREFGGAGARAFRRMPGGGWQPVAQG